MEMVETRSDQNTTSYIKKLSNTVREELESLHKLSDNCCIYEVPKRLRQLNEKAYTPQVVSIGPIHHGKKELQLMEEHKRRYLQVLLQKSGASLEEFILVIKNKEGKLRDCYAENVKLCSEDFVKVILIDAAFIITLLVKHHKEGFFQGNDRVCDKPWMVNDVRFDLLLLENQVPFFILDCMLDVSKIGECEEGLSMIKLTQEFFKVELCTWVTEYALQEHDFTGTQHFLDFLWICHQPPFLDQPERDLETLTTPSALELQRAGVTFQLSSSESKVDIGFINGVLHIPSLNIRDQTEILLRNLQAYEQLHRGTNYVSDYIALFNSLLNTQKDVEILVENGIIENWLSSEAVSELLHNLNKENFMRTNSCFGYVIEDLNNYYKVTWHKWKATLKQDYFNTPWTIFSFIGAGILLLLTITQTVCSIIQVIP